MQRVEKKKKRQIAISRRILFTLTGSVLMLAAVLCLYLVFRKEPVPQVLYREMTEGELTAYSAEQVTAVTAARIDGTGWRIIRDSEGGFRSDRERSVDPEELKMILNVTASIGWDRILTENPGEWKGNMEEFGLDHPRLTVTVAYHDGASVTFHVGNRSSLEDEAFCYMFVDGDDRLFALDVGTFDTLNIDESMLYVIPETNLHRGRIDSIRILDGSGKVTAGWELRADITDGDNADNWFVTEPFEYPADGEVIGNLRSNLSSMSLGNWICTAEEILPEYGFEDPRGGILVHMNAGSIGTVDEEGKYVVTDFPESEFVLTVGNHRNDMTSYILTGGDVYVMSDLILAGFFDLKPEETVSRYFVTEPLNEIDTVTVKRDGSMTVYEISTEKKTDGDGMALADEEGNPVYDVKCLKDGTEIPGEMFEAFWNRMLVVTAAGKLPEEWKPEGEPQWVLTVRNVSGREHTAALMPFDALHVAMVLDGCQLFYLSADSLPEFP